MTVEKELFKAAPMVQHDGQSCPQKARFLKASMEIQNSPSWNRKFHISQRHPQSTLKTSVQYLAPKNPIPMRTTLDFMTFLQESLLQIQVDANLLVANPFPFSFSFLKEEMMMMIPGNSTKNKKRSQQKSENTIPMQASKELLLHLENSFSFSL
jgi:hypothetical protein